ncbi:hypothetical protein HU230_0001340 [Bradyrhizobium quebecense]|uniref:Uncharacterized protein n=1 Tax=Bradyrhizobium quebecense TaxID=2748629 RepID=A0A973WVB3_9BRAD|nr:hypothetical protein [Bradyrhizobium quebecense]UGA44715.1 hypothetical protein HU230_0001340 [Bradyrhizobium quebecense]
MSDISLSNGGGRSGSADWHAAGQSQGPSQGPSHSYPLLVRDHGLGAALKLLLETLPYALARWGVLLGFAAACVVWAIVAVGGAVWLGTHVASVFGYCWLLGILLLGGWIWGAILRYTLNMIACGHVAVLTELITHGRIGNGSEGQFAYGRRIVMDRFGEVAILFGLGALIRAVLRAFHNALDTLGDWLPAPGMKAIVGLLNTICRPRRAIWTRWCCPTIWRAAATIRGATSRMDWSTIARTPSRSWRRRSGWSSSSASSASCFACCCWSPPAW